MARLHSVADPRGGEEVTIFETSSRGAGPAVVMLHGWRSNRSEAGLFTQLECAAVRLGFCSIRFDFAGHGERTESLGPMDDLIRADQYRVMLEEGARVLQHASACSGAPPIIIGSCSGAHLPLLTADPGWTAAGLLAIGALPLMLHEEDQEWQPSDVSSESPRLGKVLVVAGRRDHLLEKGLALFGSAKPRADEMEVALVDARRPFHSQRDMETVLEESGRWLKAMRNRF